jgi:hypothetical protein
MLSKPRTQGEMVGPLAPAKINEGSSILFGGEHASKAERPCPKYAVHFEGKGATIYSCKKPEGHKDECDFEHLLRIG